jgi:N6-L-threonylcarbamoyladenine synthase
LLVGLAAAKTISAACQIPLLAVNHLQAHVYASRIASGEDVFPCIGLVVSGGHTSLYHCRGPVEFEMLGGTIDDAAGEAFDKVANMLGLTYPGGPAIEVAAREGDRKAHRFPRSFLKDTERLEFSFSGLKTAVRYKIAGPGRADLAGAKLDPRQVADIAASFQEAVVDTLVGKSEQALARSGLSTLCVGGGVAANGRLRERLEASAHDRGYRLHIPPMSLCTDNAVMGAIAIEHLRAGQFEDLDLDVFPGLVREGKRGAAGAD